MALFPETLMAEPSLLQTKSQSIPSQTRHRIDCPFPTVTAAFYNHVQNYPDVVAARDFSFQPPRVTTYAQLGTFAQNLAHRLHDLGVRPGDRVPLVVTRSTEMLVGIFAILSCGAQYVPLDGGVVPDTTLKLVLKQTQAKVALCLTSTARRVTAMEGVQCQIVLIDAELELTADDAQVATQRLDLASAEHGCYVIYTSGTTGSPKGVNVTHENVTNLLCLSPGNLGIRPGTKVGQVLSISFDMAAWEILGCLCNGGTLLIRSSKWDQTLREIDTLICTPGILSRYTPEQYPNIKMVATAGEASWQSLADQWASHGTYYNCYGPTETTIVNTMSKHIPGQLLSIGRPTPNNNVYILDSDLNPVPHGEVGVIWAGGRGVSAGYVDQPDKTAEKYKFDWVANDGTLMYNTGDLGRWRPDGQIDILGRVDDQVKIKGFRVELDGVSASLCAAPGVSQAVALLFDDQIQGFISPKPCNPRVIFDHLRTCQPYYAVPSQLHSFDELPKTINGKIDKAALRRFVLELQSSSYDSATSSSEPTAELKTAVSDSSLGVFSETPDLSSTIKEKDLAQPWRGLIYRVLIPYRSLFSIVAVGNVAALITMLVQGLNKEWLSNMSAVNLTIAVLVRQDFVINFLYTICCSVPKSFPLWIRASCAKIYHLGGVHSSAAICAGMWLLASALVNVACDVANICTPLPHQSLATTVISWVLIALFCVMIAIACPAIRKPHHDLFERTHRFVGWTMLGLFWIQTFLAIDDHRSSDTPLGNALVTAPSFWLIVVSTSSIATSWLFLRRVPVEAEVLSNHAVRLHFGYTVPVNGSFARLSFRPLIEWHSFATIPAPEAVGLHPKGFSLVVSNAGDWTKKCIEKPPTHIWVRGVPTCGVMRIATLFNSVVVIATGSGIGPCLGHIQNPSCPTKVIWSTKTPQTTFGQGLLDSIKHKIPDAVIHDTKIDGRPDLVRMGYNMAIAHQAEAVIIIANEKITKQVVYGLETRGINAYGAIWDS
ncbi:AMP-binding enzyme [Dactylonectria macrodidyma]|uniref:AMP-binding enzyme n=1 Tax=Dactylonectria macrodidyma TaxID=307937 RepID=A0A9P9IWG9_9HYPO|nr:AMP-binding enzyme [Dactylonectria macrodidyma]